MRRQKFIIAMALSLPVAHNAFGVNSLSRTYEFGFEKGNLVRNWSFESPVDNWLDESWNGVPVTNGRLLAKSVGLTATSGSFVGRFVGTNGSTASTYQAMLSDFIPVEPGSAYILSMFVRTSGNTANLVPVIQCHNTNAANSTPIGNPAGLAYFQNTNAWVPYSFAFTPPAKTGYIRLALVQAAPGQGGTVYFDDVVVEKGTVATARDRIAENVRFRNEINQTLQSYSKFAGGGNNASTRKYVVNTNTFDDHRYPLEEYAPFVSTGSPDFDPDYFNKSKAFNNGLNGIEGFGSRPFAQSLFAEEPGGRVISSYEAGDDWSNRAITSGQAYVNSLVPPDKQNPPVSLESPTPVTDGAYVYAWRRDVQGKYTLTWMNSEGQLVKQASNISGRWVSAEYEYYANGGLKKALTPMDVPGNDQAQPYKRVVNYNSAGEITSTYSQDQGLQKFYRNRLGQIRFAQRDQYEPQRFSYTDYDGLNRPISKGEQTLYEFNPAFALDKSTSAGTKAEHVGMIYDDINTFQARTQISLSSILPGITIGANGNGRMVCQYALNDEVKYSAFSAARKLVANFYNYNVYGEVSEAYKYIGPVTPSLVGQNLYKVVYDYDEAHRIKAEYTYTGTSGQSLVNQRSITYDASGRVTQVLGLSNRPICSYEYYDWGGLKSILVGKTAAGSNSVRIQYTYHNHGWIREIKATNITTGNVIFQQFLGYDKKSYDHAMVPEPAAKRHDGLVTQQLLKFSHEIENGVQLSAYQYDDLGRMLSADVQENTNPGAIDGNQELDPSYLVWSNTIDKDNFVQYDDLGRITENRNGVPQAEAANYFYKDNSFKLDHVTGKLDPVFPRDASANGTFYYDSRGRMVEDRSKSMTIHYGWNDLPTDFTVRQPDGSQITEYQFYDVAGAKVASTQVRYSTFINSTQDVAILGRQEEGEPDNLYVLGSHISGEISRRKYLCYNGCDMNQLTIYYITDRGLSSTFQMGETEGMITPIDRPNGSPVPVKVIGLLKDSQAYADLLKQFFTGKIISTSTEVNITGPGDVQTMETFHPEYGTLLSNSRSIGLIGIGGEKIGRIASGNKFEYFVKNHQGSIMRTVNEDGSYSNDENWSMSYSPYGIPQVLKAGTEEVREGYTGKQFDNALTLLTHFGARTFDPQLGLWISTDPMNQFMNPYGFGGSPLNGTDKDGQCFEGVSTWFCIAVVVAGIYTGGALAQKATSNDRVVLNPFDWKYDESETWFGMAAGGILAYGALGYVAGSVALELTVGTTILGVPVSVSVLIDPTEPKESDEDEDPPAQKKKEQPKSKSVIADKEESEYENGAFSGVNTTRIPSWFEPYDYSQITFLGSLYTDLPLVAGEYLGYRVTPQEYPGKLKFQTLEMHSGGNIYASLRMRQGDLQADRVISWGGPFDFRGTGVRRGEVHWSPLDPISWLPQTFRGVTNSQNPRRGDPNLRIDMGWFNGPGVEYYTHMNGHTNYPKKK